MEQEAPNRLAPTTLRDFESYLKPDGVILSHLGNLHVAAITFSELRSWWQHEIDGKRDVRTGRNFLCAIGAVVAFAHDELIDTHHEFEPQIARFREWLGRKSKSKRARAAVDHQKHIKPIEDVDKLARFVSAARGEGTETAAAVLLLLDAGIRLGEFQGLAWGAVTWGRDRLDRRELLIEHNRPRGMDELQPPKSGRIRSVELSWRARSALRDLYEERCRPSRTELVFPELDQSNFRKRAFRRCAEAADLGGLRPKDLRDSFASHLLSQGIQVGYIARQLGHSTTQVTESSYARWMPKSDGRYTPPTLLRTGEVPADLLSRLGESSDAAALRQFPVRARQTAGR